MATKTYSYEALDSEGSLRKGSVDAESAEAVSRNLASQQLVPLNVELAGQGLKKEIKIPGIGGKTKLKDLAIFSRQFASMTSSGLTLMRSLAILEDQTVKPKLRAAIGKVRTDVQAGATLSAAMSTHPDQFPLLMVSMIRAGETGGFLDDALDRIAKMYEADANLRAEIKAAMTYPLVVAVFSILMGVGVIVFIVPVFEHMFKQFGGSLPLPTQIMVDASHNIWWIGPLILAAIIGALKLYKRRYRGDENFRLTMDRFKLRIPVFGSLFTKLAISRWARNLGTLMHVGVPIIQALDIVGDTAGNAVIRAAMEDVRSAVRVGQQMSGPLEKHPMFPPMVVQMMEVGEETGQITEMLEKVADFYDHEVEAATKALTSALEPLMVVFLGAMVGSMVVCLYLPMFSIYGKISGNQ
ncbi:MAG TPA: type II secretion system F family protein [Jatrophihabitans sp.]|jgi:type IV pilus assembly protein PilC